MDPESEKRALEDLLRTAAELRRHPSAAQGGRLPAGARATPSAIVIYVIVFNAIVRGKYHCAHFHVHYFLYKPILSISKIELLTIHLGKG